jgi:hypothetical protein
MLRRTVSLTEFTSLQRMLNTLRTLGLLEGCDYMVTWEQKPLLIINQLGDFEFENPRNIYGCVITFWDEDGKEVSKTKFTIGEM